MVRVEYVGYYHLPNSTIEDPSSNKADELTIMITGRAVRQFKQRNTEAEPKMVMVEAKLFGAGDVRLVVMAEAKSPALSPEHRKRRATSPAIFPEWDGQKSGGATLLRPTAAGSKGGSMEVLGELLCCVQAPNILMAISSSSIFSFVEIEDVQNPEVGRRIPDTGPIPLITAHVFSCSSAKEANILVRLCKELLVSPKRSLAQQTDKSSPKPAQGEEDDQEGPRPYRSFAERRRTAVRKRKQSFDAHSTMSVQSTTDSDTTSIQSDISKPPSPTSTASSSDLSTVAYWQMSGQANLETMSQAQETSASIALEPATDGDSTPEDTSVASIGAELDDLLRFTPVPPSADSSIGKGAQKSTSGSLEQGSPLPHKTTPVPVQFQDGGGMFLTPTDASVAVPHSWPAPGSSESEFLTRSQGIHATQSAVGFKAVPRRQSQLLSTEQSSVSDITYLSKDVYEQQYVMGTPVHVLDFLT